MYISDISKTWGCFHIQRELSWGWDSNLNMVFTYVSFFEMELGFTRRFFSIDFKQ